MIADQITNEAMVDSAIDIIFSLCTISLEICFKQTHILWNKINTFDICQILCQRLSVRIVESECSMKTKIPSRWKNQYTKSFAEKKMELHTAICIEIHNITKLWMLKEQMMKIASPS